MSKYTFSISIVFVLTIVILLSVINNIRITAQEKFFTCTDIQDSLPEHVYCRDDKDKDPDDSSKFLEYPSNNIVCVGIKSDGDYKSDKGIRRENDCMCVYADNSGELKGEEPVGCGKIVNLTAYLRSENVKKYPIRESDLKEKNEPESNDIDQETIPPIEKIVIDDDYEFVLSLFFDNNCTFLKISETNWIKLSNIPKIYNESNIDYLFDAGICETNDQLLSCNFSYWQDSVYYYENPKIENISQSTCCKEHGSALNCKPPLSKKSNPKAYLSIRSEDGVDLYESMMYGTINQTP